MISLRNLLTQRNLLEKIDSYAIFSAYCKNFKEIGKDFSSEFRDDKDPSCRIEHIGGDLLYSDFGEGTYRAIPFVMRKFNLNHHDALRKINFDFNRDLIDLYKSDTILPRTKIDTISRLMIKPKEKSITKIQVKYVDFSDEDKQYWCSYGWTLDMLDRASIKAISNFWITMEHNGMIDVPFSVLDEKAYSFDYYKHNGVFRRKLYFTERIGRKRFVSNVDNTIIQNWDLLPKNGGDTLFITSSKKDTGPFWHLNGYQCNACAPNNEGSFLPESVFLGKIKKRFKRIIIWFDNDETGVKNALKYAKMYDIEPRWNPIGSPKDPSDMWHKDGGRVFNQILQKAIICQEH